MPRPRRIAPCVAGLALVCAAGVAHAQATQPVPADSTTLAKAGTAVLCEALVFLDYATQQDRIMVALSRTIADRLVQAAAQALQRAGRRVVPPVHASSGILLDPRQEYRLAWERPARERIGSPPFARPPFHTNLRVAARESTLADWRNLARLVAEHDSTARPEAAHLARDLHAGEVLVIVARGSRKTAWEQLKRHRNPLAGAMDDERVNDARITLDLALYEGTSGRQAWTFPHVLVGWNANSTKRVAEWMEAALVLIPSPGTVGRHDDVGTSGFHAPYRGEMALRLGATGLGRDHTAPMLGTRAAVLIRPWISAGYQIDWQATRSSRFLLGGETAGDPLEYRREVHDASVDLFPVYPMLEAHLPRIAGALASVGVSAGYALAFLKASDYELQIFGGWGWSAHAGVRWRSTFRHAGIGLEGMYQRVQPERDGTDPVTLARVRERMDLDGFGLLLSLNVWQ